jgi:hypothetical protein
MLNIIGPIIVGAIVVACVILVGLMVYECSRP